MCRIWNMVKNWLGIHMLDTASSNAFVDVNSWWGSVIHHEISKRKTSVTRVLFNHKQTPPPVIIRRIRNDAALWVVPGAKHFLGICYESRPFSYFCTRAIVL